MVDLLASDEEIWMVVDLVAEMAETMVYGKAVQLAGYLVGETAAQMVENLVVSMVEKLGIYKAV